MTLTATLRAAFAGAQERARKIGHLYLVGGPVGVFYTLKLTYIKRRQARLMVYLVRERDLHREHLNVLNHQLTQLVDEQQRTSAAAAQFWNWCEKKAGVQP